MAATTPSSATEDVNLNGAVPSAALNDYFDRYNRAVARFAEANQQLAIAVLQTGAKYQLQGLQTAREALDAAASGANFAAPDFAKLSDFNAQTAAQWSEARRDASAWLGQLATVAEVGRDVAIELVNANAKLARAGMNGPLAK